MQNNRHCSLTSFGFLDTYTCHLSHRKNIIFLYCKTYKKNCILALWLGCERCLSVVKSNGGKIEVKCGCVSSWHNVFHYCYCLVYRVIVLNFLLINLLIYSCNCICCLIGYGVSFIVCVDLCAVFCLSGVLFCVICVICVLSYCSTTATR
jgi:hypothetical protein